MQVSNSKHKTSGGTNGFASYFLDQYSHLTGQCIKNTNTGKTTGTNSEECRILCRPRATKIFNTRYIKNKGLYIVGFLYTSVSLDNSVPRLFDVSYVSLCALPTDELTLFQELPAPTASGWVSHILMVLQALLVDCPNETTVDTDLDHPRPLLL